jgi:D-3-phosphoglycerate dehydrogenase
MKVLVTRSELFNKRGIELLEEYFEVINDIKGPIDRCLLLDLVIDTDAIILPWQTEVIDKEAIDRAQKLRVVARVGVGYENIDVGYATEKGILVTYCPVHIPTVADNAFGLLLCVSRKISSGDAFVKSGKWPKIGIKAAFNFIGHDIHSRTLGIIGLGRIGIEIAKRAKGFNMNILYYDIVIKRDLEKEFGLKKVTLDDLLKESDFVIISCPFNEETTHLINAQKLGLMKSSAFIINTARGGIVDQDALYQALVNRQIAGAGLDVFEKEPIQYDDPLLQLDNVVLTPHTGAHTCEANENMAKATATDVIKALQGKRPNYLLNDAVLKLRSSQRE